MSKVGMGIFFELKTVRSVLLKRQSAKNCQFTALHRQLTPLALDHIGLFKR